MKNVYTLILTLLILSFLTAKAQKGFEFGPTYQVQSTWMLNSDDTDSGQDLDYVKTFATAYGIQMGYGFHARHGLRVGLLMSQQGQEYTTSSEFLELPNTKYFTKTEYIQIPVLYRYNGDLSIANSAFILTLGPQFGMLQSATGTRLNHNKVSQTAFLEEGAVKKADFNSMDISAHLGLGILARFSPKFHMNATLNFDYSINDIEASAFKMPNRAITRNAVVSLNVGFFLLLGGPDLALPGPAKVR
jgi:hypothetical protein